MFNQSLNNINWNPIAVGFVAEPWQWISSSATDYFTKKGLLNVVMLDGF
jgi:hypothetical protein